MCNDIRAALVEHGWLLVKYNKVLASLHDTIFSDMIDLFELPYKIKVHNTSIKPWHCYIRKIPSIPLR